MALRAWSPEALERRVAGDRGDRARRGLDRRRPRPRPRLPLPRSRRPRVRALLRGRALRRRPTHLRPSLQEPAAALHRPRLRRSSGSTTSTCSPPTSRANREFAVDVLGYRLYERIELDDGTEAGAWMSLTIAAHELIYTRDALRRARPPAPPRVLGRHARGVPARGRHLPRRTASTSRPRRRSTRSPQGFFLYGFEPGGNRDRGHHRRPLRLRPRRAEPSSGPRPSARRARPGASRPSRASTRTARRRSSRAAG